MICIFLYNFLTKQGSRKDIGPAVPVIVDSRDANKGSCQQGCHNGEKFPEVASAVKEPYLARQIHCQIAKPRKRPCTIGMNKKSRSVVVVVVV